VYVKSFGGDGCGDGKGKDDEACAVTSIYAGRVPLSTGEEVVGMLASAGCRKKHWSEEFGMGLSWGFPSASMSLRSRNFFEGLG
jgi:hypothetical protein